MPVSLGFRVRFSCMRKEYLKDGKVVWTPRFVIVRILDCVQVSSSHDMMHSKLEVLQLQLTCIRALKRKHAADKHEYRFCDGFSYLP